MVRENNPIVEQVIIEEQTVEELQEQVKELKEVEKKFRLLSLFRKKKIGELEKELGGEREHSDKMDDLAWESLRAKNEAEKERDELKEEKDKKIGELEKEGDEKGEEIRKLKEEKDNLQQELNQLKNHSPKQNQTNSPWQPFYNWLQTNIFDINNNNISIKQGKRSKYPSLTSKTIFNGLLLNILEKTLDLPLKSYNGKQPQYELVEKIIVSPTDVENIAFHLNSNLEQILHHNKDIRREYGMLFIEWKNNIN